MDRLKTKRAARRAQNTKLIQEARSLLTDPTADNPKLTGIYDRLSASNSELSKINDALEEHLADEELEAEYVAAAEYNDQAISMLAEIRCRVADLGRGDSTAATAPQNATPSAPDAPTRIGPRLPNLGMPTFRGDIHEWSAFWEQFEQTVHLNNALSTTTKFFYLRHYLAGEAAAAISGFPTSESCYADAIELLKERFGDRKRIEQHHLSALRSLPHVKSGSDVRGLRRLYDAVQLNIRCLTALNVPTLSFSAMLIDILQQALPYDIVLAYTRGKRSQALRESGSSANVFEPAAAAASSDAELKELLTFTRVELESREQCKPFAERPVDDRAQRTRGSSTSTASVLHSASCNWNECFFCKSKKHGTRACDADLSVTSKKEMLTKDNRCYRCTSRGHQARSCQVKLTCSSCHGRHASSMCDPNYRKNMAVTPRPVDASGSTVGMVSSQSVMLCDKDSLSGSEINDREVYLQTFRAFVVKDNSSRYVRGILDGGSQRSFVTEELVRKLHLQVLGETRIALNTFGCASPSTAERRKVVEVPLRSQHSSDTRIVRAIVVPVICHDIASPKADSHFLQNLRLEGKFIADEKKFDAETENGLSLLIGADHLWQVMSGEIVKSAEVPGLVAIDTAFGWTLQGPSQQKAFLDCDSSLMVCILKVQAIGDDETTSQILQSFWQLEAMGITDSGESPSHESVAGFRGSISKKDNRYTVALPWKEDKKPLLGNNREIALSRLQRLTRRLSTKEGLLQRYDIVIRQYLELGHAEVVPKDSPLDRDRAIYYMPHREVIREESLTTKLRVVFDASSHTQGVPSLNDCLDKGVNLNPELLQVLLRFRWFPVAINSDIEKAFLQIEIQETDRDAFRFLWFDTTPISQHSKLVEWRMTRVPFGSTSSPFLLMATIHYHLDNACEDKALASTLKKAFYVDDLLVGAETFHEGLRIYEQSKAIMRDAGMNLRKWKTNNHQLQNIFDNQEEQVEGASREAAAVLGMQWDIEKDYFKFSSKSVAQYLVAGQPDTKRTLLKAASRIYDPLGILSPFTVTAKLLFQRLWVLGRSWDDQLPEEIKTQWTAWCADVIQLGHIKIPRCVRDGLHGAVKEAELHIFVDASLKAYGACAYLRAFDEAGNSATSLIVAKSRVAPIKTLTLPKLELMAAVVGARLLKYICSSWDSKDFHCVMWTDSMITLSWIRGDHSMLSQL